MYNSKDGYFLQKFSWHSSKIDALLELPPEIMQCICAEHRAHGKRVHHRSLTHLPLQTRNMSEPFFQLQPKRYGIPGLYSVPVQPVLLNSPLIVSFGDNLAEHLNIAGEQNAEQKVELLTWTGCSTN